MSCTVERSFHLANQAGRRGGCRRVAHQGEEPAPAAPPAVKPAVHPLARRMAMAIECKRLIESGGVPDAAAMARIAGVTRARMTQILNLNLLAPDLQECLIFSVKNKARSWATKAAGLLLWERQRKLVGR